MPESDLETISRLMNEGLSSRQIARAMHQDKAHIRRMVKQLCRQRIESPPALDRALACLGQCRFGKADDRGPDNCGLFDFLRAVTT